MSILSRYILREFLTFLLYCLLAFTVIFILVDTVEMLDGFIDTGLGIRLIVYYYAFYLPFIIVLTLPVAMLLATMFSLGRLVGDNEVTAMKASGISLYRIVTPLYLLALIIGFATMYFSEMVVPRTNQFREDIKEHVRFLKRGQTMELDFSMTGKREKDRSNVYLRNADGRIVHAGLYRANIRRAEGVDIFEPDLVRQGMEERAGFSNRIQADSLTWNDGRWTLHNAVVRSFDASGQTDTTVTSMPLPGIRLEPSDFARLDMEPEEMNYFELREYIEKAGRRGGDASEWLVDLYLKISFPFVSFVIVFFGAPMVAGSSLRGKTAMFGISLIICFIFYALVNLFQVLGRSGAVDPLVAAWLPNGLFFIVGLVMHLRASK